MRRPGGRPDMSKSRYKVHGPAFAHIAAFHPELTALRRDLHAHPELGFEEVYTAKRVVESLKVCGRVDVVRVGKIKFYFLDEGRVCVDKLPRGFVAV